MNPYLLAGLAAVAFFLLRGNSPATTAATTPANGTPVGPTARPVLGGGEAGGILFSGAEDAFTRAIEDAIRRGQEEAKARREQIATARAEQATSLADLETGAAVKRFALSPRRSMTDFGA